MNIGKLIAASLEDAGGTADAAAVADTVAEIAAAQTDETSPLVEIAKEQSEATDVVDALGEIADLAEIVPEADETVPAVASVESLQLSLAMVLRSHGTQATVSSLESAGAADRPALAAVARRVAGEMRAKRQVSFESAMSDVRGNLGEQADLIKKSGAILTKIQADLKSNGALVQGKSLSYLGIYNFLHVDGVARYDIGNVLKEEKAKLEQLVATLSWFEKAYKNISLDRDSDPEKALDVLTRTISTLDYTGELAKLDGLKLLGNGTVELSEEYDYPLLDLEYQVPKGDGSKATIGSRVLNSLIPAGIGGVIGGLIGRLIGGGVGALVGGLGGIEKGATLGGVAGAGTGIYFGVKKGITKADAKVVGKETQVELTVDDVIAFVASAQDLLGLVDKIRAQLIVADQGDTQMRAYLKTLHANMNKDDRWKVGAAKIAGVLATALLVGVAGNRGGSYNGPVIGAGIKTHADEIIGNAADLVGAVYTANVSVADVLVTHVLNCVKGAIGVGAALLGEDPTKAVK